MLISFVEKWSDFMWLTYEGFFFAFSLGRKREEKLSTFGFTFSFGLRPGLIGEISDGFALSLGRHGRTCDELNQNSKLICCVYSLGRINKTDSPYWHILFTIGVFRYCTLVSKTFVLFFHWEGKTLNKAKFAKILNNCYPEPCHSVLH